MYEEDPTKKIGQQDWSYAYFGSNHYYKEEIHDLPWQMYGLELTPQGVSIL